MDGHCLDCSLFFTDCKGDRCQRCGQPMWMRKPQSFGAGTPLSHSEAAEETKPSLATLIEISDDEDGAAALPQIKQEKDDTASSTSRRRDTRSRSPQRRIEDGNSTRPTRERALATRSSFSLGQPQSQEPPLQPQPDLKWCLRCHVSDHFMQQTCKSQGVAPLLGNIHTSWSQYYVAVSPEICLHPITVADIQNILLPVTIHFNTFHSFMKQRDVFLLEIDTCLKRCISEKGYKAWQLCLAVCTKATMTYLIRLQVFVKNMQKNVVMQPLVKYENAKSSQQNKHTFSSYGSDELARLLYLMESAKNSIRIRDTDHRESLSFLDGVKEEYWKACQDARAMLKMTMEQENESKLFKKHEEGVLCLSSTMLEPIRHRDYIRWENFATPNIQRLRQKWNAIGDKEV